MAATFSATTPMMNLLWLSVDNTYGVVVVMRLCDPHVVYRVLADILAASSGHWREGYRNPTKCLNARFQIIPHGEVNYSPTLNQDDSPRRMSYDDHIRAQFKILTGNGAINYVALNGNEPIW